MEALGGGEALTIMLPRRRGGAELTNVAVVAFVPEEGVELDVQCGRATIAALAAESLEPPVEWVAIAAPGYARAGSEDDYVPHGRLEQDYIDGDQRVVEVLLVAMAEPVTGTVLGQLFRQPFLSPDGDPGEMHDGPIVSAVRMVLHVANNSPANE